MRIVVIGGSGHVGTFLVPRLVEAGHDVVSVSRGRREPHQSHPSPAALTLRGYAEAVSGWFGETADLRFVPWKQWREEVSEEEAEGTWDHIAHSPTCSIAKATKLLGYRPRCRPCGRHWDG